MGESVLQRGATSPGDGLPGSVGPPFWLRRGRAVQSWLSFRASTRVIYAPKMPPAFLGTSQ
jgi:hypothetical protein